MNGAASRGRRASRSALGLALGGALLLMGAGLGAEDGLAGEDWLWAGHWQMTVVPQWHDNRAASYSGRNSLWTSAEERTSLTSTLFLATRLAPGLELYADPELSGGSGVSDTFGVAGYPNTTPAPNS